MAQNNNNTNVTNNNDDVKPTILHDFLGRGCAPVTKVVAAAADVAGGGSPSGSVSGGGGGGGGRGGGPVSTTSDLASERQVGTTYFEGVPFYGQKSDLSGSMIRYSGSKRNNPDSSFMAPSRESAPQMRPDFPETSHLMKMLRNVGAERPRWSHEDEQFMGMNQMRPTSSSHMAQPATGGKNDANASKWERAIPVNVGPVLQYPPRAGQVLPYGYQPITNRFKDSNMGSPLISQSAADEGSRTGIKGSPGILSSMAEPSSSKLKSLINNTEPGSSSPLPRQGSTSASRQMTIFYGGQAHVFDDVHPNKADVIMALAGSNGGSWSTSFSNNSALKSSGGEAHEYIRGQGNVLAKDARGPNAEQKSDEKQ
ncbi:TIFY 8-like protein [Tanacetum coccineum]